MLFSAAVRNVYVTLPTRLLAASNVNNEQSNKDSKKKQQQQQKRSIWRSSWSRASGVERGQLLSFVFICNLCRVKQLKCPKRYTCSCSPLLLPSLVLSLSVSYCLSLSLHSTHMYVCTANYLLLLTIKLTVLSFNC